jgi:hypothetical protein
LHIRNAKKTGLNYEIQAHYGNAGQKCKQDLAEIKGKPLILKFLGNFTHLMAILLWIGGIVGFIAQMPQLGIAIWMVNVINGVFSFWQEYRAEKAIEALKKLIPAYARVLRDGEEHRILAEEQITPANFVVRAIPDLSVESSTRDLFAEAQNLAVGKLENDELNVGMKKVSLKFKLTKGCYATEFVKQLFSSQEC